MNAPQGRIHDCPEPGSGVTRCCKRTPFELPHTDRMTTNLLHVTCLGPRKRERR